MNIQTLEILECPASLYKNPFGLYLLKIEYEENKFIDFRVVIDPKSNILMVISDVSSLASEIARMIQNLDKEKFLRFVDNKNFKAIELWS